MDKQRKILATVFVLILLLVVIVSFIGIWLMSNEPVVLQGTVESTEIKISGKLLGRVDTFLVSEGENVKQGDTLVVINSPEALAKFQQVNALESVAKFQNQKVDDGTRLQIRETMKQIWNKSKAALDFAQITYNRVQKLFKDSIVTSQRRDEAFALFQAAVADEKAAAEQYNMAVDGAQIQDKESAKSMVVAAGGVVEQVQALLQDARLVAPADGQISSIYPQRGELVAAGSPIMTIVVLDDAHVVLNVREDLMPSFKMGDVFKGSAPALGLKDIKFRIYYISPLGSYATWKSTKQVGSYDLRTFRIKARPIEQNIGLRPGMSILVTL